MSDTIRVGIIGASPDRGWASRAHIPALRALPGFELTAVGTSRRESADEAARIFGAAHAFTSASELAEHPDVDLVAITVKVPAHAELISAALAAGKHVYSEWPLTRTTSEAEAIVAAAASAPGHHAVGLQARFAPAVLRARELLAEGFVGEPVSATVYSSRGKGAGGAIPQWAAYTLDRENAAGLLEVAGGHTLDPLQFLLGELTELSADLAIRNTFNTVVETGERVRITSPDHLLLTARAAGNVVVSAHRHDAKLTNAHTRIEISGTDGDLVLANDTASGAPGLHAGGIQMSDLNLLASRGAGGTWQDLTPADPEPIAGLPVESRNVARLYTRLAEDIRTGEHTVPSFETGLRMHRLLDAIHRSAESGLRQPIPA
ncbi:Gfo/Idh/MocA family protein [Nocardia seriolae]|uniref:Gfo/Idh/MocA family protein n=1 Tax=Nocardia seriolae TaxID=37332 RepID=UPI000EF236D8|nr:Gfo/Idh/MocA family oxidoreductase [Nocardia seriolae]RLP32558.1 gfo/Idh/MocA family oxidoreductase [Nocardia seriolae]WKY54714.1 Gfo/Idh/MocA family oxidoreductase [Nocardia seriolae]